MALTKTPIELSSTPSIVDGGNATAITIDSSENVLVGKTSTSIGTAGHTIFASGEVFHTVAGTPLYVNRTGSDGSIQNFYKDGASIGSIGVEAGDNLYIADAATNTGLNFKGFLNPCDSSGASSRDNFDLGHSTQGRLRDLYLGGGVFLGGTGAANKLDDYEEGSWTPTVAGCSINVGRAYYTKIGNLVTANFNFTVTATDGSVNSFAIGGRPFAGSSANAESNGSLMLNYFTADANVVNVSLYTYSRESLIYIYQTITGSSWTLVGRDQIQVSPATAIIGSITYETDT